MPNCFKCKVCGLNIYALCPKHDEEGNPQEPCYQFEPKEEEEEENTD